MTTPQAQVAEVLRVVAFEIDSSTAYDDTFEAIERSQLQKLSYPQIIELGRAAGFSALVVGELLTVLQHSYDLPPEPLIEFSRRSILQGNDSYAIEVALRHHLLWARSLWGRPLRWINRDLIRALKAARTKFPHLEQLIDWHLSLLKWH